MTNDEIKSILREFSEFETAFTKLKQKYRESISPMIDGLDLVDESMFVPLNDKEIEVVVPGTNLKLVAGEEGSFSVVFKE